MRKKVLTEIKPSRKLKIFNEIKSVTDSTLIHTNFNIPAFLLKNKVHKHGDIAKLVNDSLLHYNKLKPIYDLLELITEIRNRIEYLELNKEFDNDSENSDLLLEIYRDVYFRLKDCEVLKRRKKKTGS